MKHTWCHFLTLQTNKKKLQQNVDEKYYLYGYCKLNGTSLSLVNHHLLTKPPAGKNLLLHLQLHK